MPTYSTGMPIMVGDWVKVLSRFGVWHHGIVRQIMFTMSAVYVEIANNVKAGGITVSDWNQFSEGREVVLCHRASSPAHVQEIMARVNGSMGQPYHLFAQNCEHFASFAFYGKAESKSMQTLGLFAAGVVVVKLLTGKNTSA
jgi:hypothetical protein